MRKPSLNCTLLLLTALAGTGCGDTHVEPAFVTTRAPNTLEDALFYVSSSDNGGRALTLDVATDDAKVVPHELPEGPVQTFVFPGSEGRQVVVFTAGLAARKEGNQRTLATPAHVLLFSREGELLRQPLSGRYENLTLSDDGKYAIAYGSSGNLVLQNAIEVIDLEKAKAQKTAGQPLTAATVMDLSFDGRAPTNFVFSPSGGYVHRLAIAPLANSLQVVDLEHPENGEISIKLSDQAALQPLKIVFARDQFFVQSENSPRILSFQNIDTPAAGLTRPFQLAPSNLTASANVTDLETVGQADTLRLLALTGNLEVIDPRVDSAVSVPGVSAFQNIHKFSGISPTSSQSLPRAVLYGVGRAQLGFVDLGDEKAWATRNVELIELGDPLLSLIPVTETLALATHSTNRISLIDLAQRTVKRVLLDSATATALLEPVDAQSLRLWVGGSDGTLGSINLSSQLASEVPLTFSYASSGAQGGDPQPSTDRLSALQNQGNLLLVPGPLAAPRHRIAVVQSAASGRVTLLDANNPTPDTALEVLGFFLASLFD